MPTREELEANPRFKAKSPEVQKEILRRLGLDGIPNPPAARKPPALRPSFPDANAARAGSLELPPGTDMTIGGLTEATTSQNPRTGLPTVQLKPGASDAGMGPPQGAAWISPRPPQKSWISPRPPDPPPGILEAGPSAYIKDTVASQVDPASGPGRQALQVATAPIRLARGAGVLAQRMSPSAAAILEQGPHKAFKGNIEATDPKASLGRAAAATRPGYVPQPGEKLGAFAGEALATAPLAALTGGGSIPAQIAKGALGAGAYTAVMEAAEKGDINKMDVVLAGAVGGSVPIVIPSLAFIARTLHAAGEVGPTVGTNLTLDTMEQLSRDTSLLDRFQGTAKAVGERVVKVQQALIKQHQKVGAYLHRVRKNAGISEEFKDWFQKTSVEGFTPVDDPDIILQRFSVLKGGQDVVRVAAGSDFYHITSAKNVGKIRSLGLKPSPTGYEGPGVYGGMSPEHAASYVGALRPGKDVMLRLKPEAAGKYGKYNQGNMDNERIITKRIPPEDLEISTDGETWTDLARRGKGEAGRKARTPNEPSRVSLKEMNPRQRLKDLYELRDDVKAWMEFYKPKPGAQVVPVKSKNASRMGQVYSEINNVIDSVPGGRTLRAADTAYHLSRKLYDALQKKIATQGQAEQVIMQIAKGGDLNEVIGLKGDNLRLIQNLERKMKTKFLEPLMKELAAKNLRELRATSWAGIPAKALGPEGVANFVKGAKLAAKLPAAGARLLASPVTKAALYSYPRQR